MFKFDCDVRIVDEIMGRGKTSSAINFINKSKGDERFIYITPYLTEVERIKEGCPSKRFKEPYYLRGRKLEGIKDLINKGENIVSTHALFQKFDLEIVDLCRAKNYTLIMDEVANVVEKYEITKTDYEILAEKFVSVDENTGLLKWIAENKEYDNGKGKFSKEKTLCELGSLAVYGGSIMMWLFPIGVFNAFRKIIIMTYMFDSQIQKYYYDYYKLPYKYMYVTGNSRDTYCFTDDVGERPQNKYNFDEIIHICDDEKLNRIGDREYDLSKSWYERNKNNSSVIQLKNNIANFFIHKRQSRTMNNLWTTFKNYKNLLNGNGYGRGYVPLNMRASNKYANKSSVAYVVNRYIDPVIKNFFSQHNIQVDEDGYALSEMLQFIWRSAIRKGEEIWVYIPSVRMRDLLKRWIEENSLKGENLVNAK